MNSLRLGILGSGQGGNCRQILERIRAGTLAAEVRLIVSDVFDARILEVAREFAVPNAFLQPGKFRTKLEPGSEAALARMLQDAEVEIVALAGFMRVLKKPMLNAFPRRIINIHPSLLPKFPGREAWRQALEAGEHVTGCTVHYVDAGIDSGDIIAQRTVPVLANDTAKTLHARIQIAERDLYPEVLQSLAISRV